VSLPTILGALVLVIGAPLNLYVTFKLWRLSRERPQLRVLRERALVAFAVLVVVVVFGLIFLNNDLDAPILTFDQTKLYTRAVMLFVAVGPASYWLYLYRVKGVA
jgi:small neutral amino acid transporter SnatA (MarC family)